MTWLTRSNDPLSDFRTLQNRLFEPFFGRFNFLDDALPSGTWAPAVDVAEDKDRIHVKVEVPGMEEKDLRINYEDGLLTVSGERQFEKRDDRSYHRIERAYGTFVRSFNLPRTVDPNKIVASYRDGVLEIEIPKKDEAKPKKIEINAGRSGV
jgi:HSP20 family protein